MPYRRPSAIKARPCPEGEVHGERVCAAGAISTFVILVTLRSGAFGLSDISIERQHVIDETDRSKTGMETVYLKIGTECTLVE